MRAQVTPAFSATKAAWKQAYADYDIVADDPNATTEQQLRGPESLAEHEAMTRLVEFPAVTAGEIGAKLAFMRDRDIDQCWTKYPEWMAQIERELIELQRPCVSPSIAKAFGVWRDAYAAYHEDCEAEGNSGRHSAAFVALMAAPCFTPGDFVVKVYANQLGEHGSTSFGLHNAGDPPGGFMFELDDSLLGEGMGTHDGAAEEAFARDIRESDLGRCLLALGRVDFDAEAWFAAVRRAGMVAHLVIQTDGTQALWTGQPSGEVGDRASQRFEICQALLGGGMGVVGQDRRTAVMDYIASAHPDLVMDCRLRSEVAA